LDINLHSELPCTVKVSFKSLVDAYAQQTESQSPFVAEMAKGIVKVAEAHPVLVEGFEKLELLDTHKQAIEKLLEPTFNPILTENEIKTAHVPFYNRIFKSSNRFKKIVEKAGPDFDLKVKNLPQDQSYIIASALILKMCYGYDLNFKRPFFYEIPDENGIMRYYKILYNADFVQLIPKDNAIEITQADFDELLDNFNNIDLWKKKFPPFSYELNGFLISNIVDVTDDQSISNIKTALIKEEEHQEEAAIDDFNDIFRSLFGLKDLEVGFSSYNADDNVFEKLDEYKIKSFLLNNKPSEKCSEALCGWSYSQLLKKNNYFSISDIEARYDPQATDKPQITALHAQGIKSAIFAPIANEQGLMGILEIVSHKPKVLNSINANKLLDVMPYIVSAIQRSKNEEDNLIKAIIQKECTSIHPSVYWRFEKKAKKYIKDQHQGSEQPSFGNIVFKNVYPLYGQIDIKGSSEARNWATQQDLKLQLNSVAAILNKAIKDQHLPILDQYIFQINQYQESLEHSFQVDSERQISAFLSNDIEPVLQHVSASKELRADIDAYFKFLDAQTNAVYQYRKDYDTTISRINTELALFLDRRQVEAQTMYPHFFERFKTDGVEHNMYIGESITKEDSFNPIFLYNLRLWQLQVMCEMENAYYKTKSQFPIALDVASMVLVFNQPLSISFRTDEKQFDVDGTYNARYEIVKKRVDKAFIKGTTERITQQGKLTIVYSQKEDEQEYLRYIKFLQARNYLDTDEEILELEDLVAVTGLKAIRVSILYHKSEADKTYYTYQDLIDTIEHE